MVEEEDFIFSDSSRTAGTGPTTGLNSVSVSMTPMSFCSVGDGPIFESAGAEIEVGNCKS